MNATNGAKQMNGKIVVIDSRNGQHLRDANEVETGKWFMGQRDARFSVTPSVLWDNPVRLSKTETAVHYNGPGAWYGGAGF